MILCDRSIRERLQRGAVIIEPFDDASLQPTSYDLKLDSEFLMFDAVQVACIDVREPAGDMMRRIRVGEDEAFVLHPGQFALANTREVVGVDACHVGWLEGKSSLGRLGLVIHATAGFLDLGNHLRMTLELANLGPLPIKLASGRQDRPDCLWRAGYGLRAPIWVRGAEQQVLWGSGGPREPDVSQHHRLGRV